MTVVAAPVNLTDDEINDICRPRTQGHAQIKYLRELGLLVERRIDGTPLVSRAHYEAVMSGKGRVDAEPDPTNGPRWKVPA